MKRFTNYHFVLVLRHVNEETPGLLDALYEAGCDDALVSFRNGVISLDFDRDASSLDEAIMGAIHAIEASPIHAEVDHVDGAFVTMTEIAEKTGFTKQAISLFVKGMRGKGMFPVPFAGINSTSPIWRWSDVVEWMANHKKIHETLLLEEATVIDGINMALLLRRVHPVKDYQKRLASK